MRVAIAGAHGQIALRLIRRLKDRGDFVVGLIRNPDHADDLIAAGCDPVICDLEHSPDEELQAAVEGMDAVVFAAGAGPGSGAERKLTVDRDGAIRLLRAAEATGIRRYVIVSAVGAEQPPDDDAVFSVYLRAKADADAAVADSGLDWTILRPGGLTDDPGDGRVRLGSEPFRGEVSRDDVAAVLAAVLHEARLARRTLYLSGGETPIDAAVAALAEG